MAELFTNLARSTLASGITAGATSLTVLTGDGNDLFPALGGSDFFRCVLFKKSTGDIEIIKCTARSGDVFTISRAQEQVGNIAATAFAFDAGDLIELRPTKGFFDSLGSVTTTAVQSMSYNYGTDTGAVNAYSVALTPSPASYAAPLPMMFVAGATNTGASTLEETSLGTPKNILRLDGANLRPGDIVVNEVVYVLYDGSNFKLLNPRSKGEASDYTFDGDLNIAKVAHFSAVHDYGSVTATSTTIDWNNGNKQKITLAPSTGNNITFTFTAPPGPTDLKLKLVQDASGARTVTWPAGTLFVGGIEPILSTVAGAVDIATIYYDAGAYHVGITKGWAVP